VFVFRRINLYDLIFIDLYYYILLLNLWYKLLNSTKGRGGGSIANYPKYYMQIENSDNPGEINSPGIYSPGVFAGVIQIPRN
jgi:hypothetical protein